MIKIGLLKRLGAIFYDSLLVFSLLFVVGLLSSSVLPTNDGEPNPWFFFAITLPTTFFYFAISWIKSGQTLGMMAWHIRLMPSDSNNKININQCLIRFLVAIPAWTLFFYSWLNPDGNMLHDQLSKTRITNSKTIV